MGQNNIIYISGYGRSGSTLLTILLDNIEGVVGLGEVGNLPRYMGKQGRECSCNNFYSNCDFWGDVINNLPSGTNFIEELGTIQRKVEPWNRGWATTQRIKKQYNQKIKTFFEKVFRTTGARAVVDSSKSAYSSMWRALALSRVPGLNVFVVHLVRDAEAVVSSCKKGRSIDLELDQQGRSGLAAASTGLVGWTIANLAAVQIRRYLDNDQSMTLRYEDLVRSPGNQLCKIIDQSHLSQDASTPLQKNDEFAVGHLVAGNRMARNNNYIQIDPSKSSKSRLSKVEKFAVCRVAKVVTKIINA